MVECESRWDSWHDDEPGDAVTHEPGRPWVAVCRQHNRRANGGTEQTARDMLRNWCASGEFAQAMGVC